MTRRTPRLAVLLLLVPLTTACTSDDDATDPGYTPVPDAELFDEIAQLDGVVEADVAYVDRMGTSNSYRGNVYVRGADRCEVLDRTWAILRQGSPEAHIAVTVVRGTPPPSDEPAPIGLSMGDLDPDVDLDPASRYGDQPGSGEPPDDALCASQ